MSAYLEQADGMERRSAPVRGTPGIKEEQITSAFTQWLMTVAKNQAIERIIGKLPQHSIDDARRSAPAMNQTDAEIADLDDPFVGQFRKVRIEIAPDRKDVSGGQMQEDIGIDDVAGMKYGGNTLKMLFDNGTQPRTAVRHGGDMGIGEYTNAGHLHGGQKRI